MKELRNPACMRMDWLPSSKKRNIASFTLSFFMLCSVYFFILGVSNVNGEVYSSDDKPFGTSKDVWLSNFWTWWVKRTADEVPPKPEGCLINNSSSMVMLMETTVSGKPHQVCKISSTQGIIIPLWVAFMEDSTPEFHNYTYEQLSKAAREMFNLGAVTSLVKVDGNPIAKLDVVSSMRSGKLDYKINSMNNVSEVYSKGFNITIPENTHIPDQNTGTWRSGAHGWLTFLKPLPPGNHTIDYNVGVTGLGENDHSSEITYSLNVENKTKT